MTDTPDPVDILESRVDALNDGLDRLEQTVDRLEAENERLHDRVTELERVVDPDPESEGYGSLTREQKVFRLRTALVTEALQNGGRAAMKYGEAKSTFGNRPSPGHTYDLMELAGKADGFDYNKDTGEWRLTVKTEAVNDETVIRTANKALAETPA